MGARRNVDPLPPFTIAELLSRLGKAWKVPKANKFIPTAYWQLSSIIEHLYAFGRNSARNALNGSLPFRTSFQFDILSLYTSSEIKNVYYLWPGRLAQAPHGIKVFIASRP